MELLTRLPKLAGSSRIGYDSNIVSLGSCFAVNMSEKLDYYQFRNTTNPFGILFSTEGILTVIRHAVNGKKFSDADVFQHNERWHCFDAHSDLSGTKDEILSALNSAAVELVSGLEKASHLLITLGTAWVYEHLDSGKRVANCHKVPQSNFRKVLISPHVIRTQLLEMNVLIRCINPNATLIFTVSPVRHLKDGFVENQRSKAHLITGLHEALSEIGNASYFPAYEIMMDELRDYRFYASDMLHPNELAISYLWEHFTDCWIADEARSIMTEVDSIKKSLAHRPFDPDGEAHRRFQEALDARIESIRKRYPFLCF